MKRIISILLCLVMVLSSVTLLASCSKSGEGEPKVSKKQIAVDLTDYVVVCGSELNSDYKQAVVNFAARLKALTSVSLRTQTDSESEAVETEDLEILVGQTNRVETQKALKATGDLGWAVQVFDNKIVIVGTTPFLTRAALSWFTENCIENGTISGTTISVYKKAVVKDLETVALTADGMGRYTIVYSHNVDDVVNSTHYASDSNPVSGGNATDYIYDTCGNIQTLLGANTDAKGTTFPFKEDTTEASGPEILVGQSDRELMKNELSTMNANEYAVAIRDGNILIAAWNDTALTSAVALFEGMIKGSTIQDEEGNSTLLIPANCAVKETVNNGWTVDFPKPDGADITLHGTVDVNDNSIEYIYTGSGVNRESYVAYCEKLEAAGFKTITTENQVEGNSFRTYLNEETGVTLHVYHVAYTNYDEYKETHKLEYYGDTLASIRIVASSTDYVTLPDDEMLNPNQQYTWITSPMITQSKLDGESDGGMSYIVTLADGSFILFDGGYKFTNSHKELWDMLVALYKESHDGNDPSSADPIRIRAWVMTHEHQDHFGTFLQFVQNYGQNTAVKLERLLFNSTSTSERYNCHNPENTVQASFESLQSRVNGGFKIIKMHTGQIYYFANMKMEVLYTHEDAYPKGLEYFNNSTTVVRTTLSALNGKSDTATSTCIWLGDAERIVSRRLIAMYGDTLDVDQVQVAHHGHTGVYYELYEVMSPEVLWWPTRFSAFKNRISSENSKTWYYRVNYKLVRNIASVKLILVADTYDTTMTITGKASDYEDANLFDLVKGKEITSTTSLTGGVIIHKVS